MAKGSPRRRLIIGLLILLALGYGVVWLDKWYAERQATSATP
ncbi:MAG: hypothetical protein OER86_11845 [Phycisphaerae bacterium]|nr:hypothetical protein [Phycisphaerae bacterium]